MKKPLKKNKSWDKKKIAVFVTAAGLIIFGSFYYVIPKVHYYDDVANQAGLVNVRELTLLAVRGLKKDAPVEPRTGDVYFPESRLYLPNPDIALPLTYLIDNSDVTNSQAELSISTYPVRGTHTLYMVRDVEHLFEAVPKLQACSRGVKLVSNKFPPDNTQNELKHTVRLNNGKELFIYLEKACPELNDTADLLKNIQAY
ncbi:MAG: hypothetical protein V4702_00320 [Patescibacteria group bacterium]